VGYEVASDLISLQPFSSFRDFVIKARSIGRLKKDMVEALIFAGCMDEFMPSKKKIKTQIENNLEDGINGLGPLLDYAKIIYNKNLIQKKMLANINNKKILTLPSGEQIESFEFNGKFVDSAKKDSVTIDDLYQAVTNEN